MNNDNEITILTEGRYFWELLFSYKNPGKSKITQKQKFTIRTVVDYKEFLSRSLKINAGFEYKDESRAKVTYMGQGEGSNTTSFSLHVALAEEVARRVESHTMLQEEETIEQQFDVGPGDEMKLYRLCYDADGVLVRTKTFASSPGEDVIVKLNFSCRKYIVGLESILGVFGSTHPGSSNIVEWNRIRDTITQHSDLAQEERFRHFVDVLATTVPGHHNTVEWHAIRTTCGELQQAWASEDKQLLFLKLLHRFADTYPGIHNKTEWARIRNESSAILHAVQPHMD